MADNIVSRPFRPDPAMACERCVFGTGRHLEQCHVTVLENVQIPWIRESGTLILDRRVPQNVIETLNLDDWSVPGER